MKDLRYERITNSAVIIAILSALLFDRVESAKWVFGALGILSAIAAAVTYFVNQWSGSNNPDLGAVTQHCADPVRIEGMHVENTQVVDLTDLHVGNTQVVDLTDQAEDFIAWANTRVVSWEHLDELPTRRWLQANRMSVWSSAAALNVWNVSSQTHPSLADEVVAIVDSLCSVRDDSFEFVIAPDGTFTIRRSAPALRQGVYSENASAELIHRAAESERTN